MRKHLQNWGALYILAIFFFGSIVGQYVYQVVLEQESFNQFMVGVFENWQSEWIQLFVQALLIQGMGHILYRKEKEDEERIEKKLDHITRLLEK